MDELFCEASGRGSEFPPRPSFIPAAVSAPQQPLSLSDNTGKTTYEPAPLLPRCEILSSRKVSLRVGVSLVSDSQGSDIRDFVPAA